MFNCSFRMLSNMKLILVTIAISFFAVTNGFECENCADTQPDKLILEHTDGYDEWNGHYYKVSINVTDWGSARKLCEDEGAYLTIINSNEEATFVRQLINEVWTSRSNYPGAWAGIHDSDGNANWRTIKGTTLKDAGYDIWWRPCQRRNKTHCGTVKTCGRYAAVPCDRQLLFICEMEIAAAAVN